VDNNDVSQWFGEYLNAFAACGRAESDTASLLAYYGVPLLLTTDDGFFALTSDHQVVAAVQQQVDGMRAAGYGRSEILGSEVTVLNSTSALYRGTFSRQRSDGGEISRLTATCRNTSSWAWLSRWASSTSRATRRRRSSSSTASSIWA
jgi:hypothetical protein